MGQNCFGLGNLRLDRGPGREAWGEIEPRPERRIERIEGDEQPPQRSMVTQQAALFLLTGRPRRTRECRDVFDPIECQENLVPALFALSGRWGEQL